MSFRFFIGLCLLIGAGILFTMSNSGRLNKPDVRPDVKTIPEIQKIVVPQADAAKLKAFYLAFADVVERDGGQKIKSWADFRSLNITAGSVCFGDELKTGGYKKLGETIDLSIQSLRKNETIDTKTLSTRLREIAWSIGGGE